MIKVSIIIPIYNAADCINDCLSSVSAQTYPCIEAILVDDCGTDDSVDIAEHFVHNYNGRVDFKFVHHQHNQGVSAARNSGIKASSGKYLFFLDSDDKLSNDCIERLVISIKQDNDIDMAIGNVSVEGVEAGWNVPVMPEGVYTDGLWDYYYNKRYYEMVWNKLINKEFILRYSLFFSEEMQMYEDSLWTFQVACHLSKISTVDNITYHYITRNGSLCLHHDKILKEKNCSKLSSLQARYALLHKKNDKMVFYYVERQRIGFFKRALALGDDELVKFEYNIIRQTPYWSPFSLLSMGCSIGMILRTLHRILPPPIGLLYYKKSVSCRGK